MVFVAAGLEPPLVAGFDPPVGFLRVAGSLMPTMSDRGDWCDLPPAESATEWKPGVGAAAEAALDHTGSRASSRPVSTKAKARRRGAAANMAQFNANPTSYVNSL